MASDPSRALDHPDRFAPARFLHGGVFVLVVALVVRLLYLIGYRSNPFFADPQMDALYHDRWAAGIARGDWLGSEVFFRAPLYAYFLAVIYWITDHSYLVARIVQLLIGAASCVLVHRIGTRIHGPVVGLVAGILAALLGPSVYYEAELLLVVLEIFLLLLSIDLLLETSEGGAGGRLLRQAFFAGTALGLLAITRPNFLLLLPVGLLFLIHQLRRFGRTRWVLALLLYLAGTFTPILPVLVRNYVVGEDFVPIASQGGLNFYLGNNPSADGMAALAPEFRPTWYGGIRDATRLAEEAMGRPLKPSEVSDYWFARGVRWAAGRPFSWFLLNVKKFLLFWQAFEIPNNEDFYFFSRYSFLFRSPLLLTFGAVAPLALAGFFLARRRKQESSLLLATIGLYALSISIFFVCGRFRAPLGPLLTVPAAYFLVEGLALLQRREWREARAPFLVLVVSALLLNADLFGLRNKHTFAESWLRLGIAHAAKDRTAEAEASYRAAIKENPRFQEAHNNLGVLYMQEGRSREALEEFETAYRIDPSYPRTLNNLAAWYEHENDLPAARKYIDQALSIREDEVEARYNAGVIYGRQGDFGASAAHFRRLLDIEPSHQAARLGLGKSLLMEQKLLEAASAFSQVVEREPRHAEALYYLGLARARMNDPAGARRAWEACLAVRPDYEPAARQLETLAKLPAPPPKGS